MINSIILTGRLTRNIELRYNNSNNAIGTFSLAVQRQFKNTNGEYETDFINCVVFGKSAESMKEYTSKGDLIGVRGNLQTRTYEDKEGNKKYVTEVVCGQVAFLSTSNKENIKKEEIKEEPDPFKEFGEEISDEDLPF